MAVPRARGWPLHTHRSWLLGQAQRLLDFFRSSVGEDGRFADLDDDGRPVPFRDASQPVPGQRLLTVARAVHCYALGELLGVPGCASIVEHGLRGPVGRAPGPRSPVATSRSSTPPGPSTGPSRPTATPSCCWRRRAPSPPATMPGGSTRTCSAVIDEHFWSEQDGAAREAFAADWEELEPYRGANANMHMCEAFLAAADATGDEALAERAARIAQLLIDRHARAHGWMLPEHYDTAWQPLLGYNRDRADYDLFRPYGATIGHMLEWSRLLPSAWIATGKSDAWMPQAAVELFAHRRPAGLGQRARWPELYRRLGRLARQPRPLLVADSRGHLGQRLPPPPHRRAVVRGVVPEVLGLRRLPPHRLRPGRLVPRARARPTGARSACGTGSPISTTPCRAACCHC